MKSTISIIIILFYINNCIGQTNSVSTDTCDNFLYFTKSHEELLNYIDNPCPGDTICRQAILKAKSDIEKGQIILVVAKGFGIRPLRQESQLRKLCDSIGLIFDYELFSDLGINGQTNGCYGLYMDKIIAQKFGRGFKENLLLKADSIYVASNPTVYFTNCDTVPRLYDKDIFESGEMVVAIDKLLFHKLKVSKYGYYPQVYIGFYIDTAGIPSGYFLSQYIVYDDIKQNNKFKTLLTKKALDYIKQFKLWKPGIILNQKVKTEFVVRISFESFEK